MSFLYRIPLFHFNIEDPRAVEENRKLILDAIRLSSPDFVKEIQDEQFEKLDLKTQLTLKKYLIRGRFRPTPFGNFAAVGIGNWGTKFNLPLPLSTIKLISTNTKPQVSDQESKISFQLLPRIHKKHKHYHGLIFDFQNQEWTAISLKENKILEILLKKAKDHSVTFSTFFQLLHPKETGASKSEIKALWKQILGTGILIPKSSPQNQKQGIDLLVTNQLEINNRIQAQLQEFLHQAGSLFRKEESPYLVDFKMWFTDRYEDRFVSIGELLKNSEFQNNTFHQPNQSASTHANETPFLFPQENTPIDLKNHFLQQPLDKAIYDIQLVYRLDPEGNPVIENMVCNRPFVYTGRFNRERQINTFTQEIKNRVYTNETTIYAHINIHEKSSINHICDVENIFDFEFTPYQPISDNQLDFQDCFLGIHADRIILYHHPSNRPIIPVVLHPLNGSYITHPGIRLLWEIAHQDRFRFLPYQYNILTETTGCPQLNWGNLCLQSKRWKITSDSIPTVEDLKQKIENLDLPNRFLAGNQDLELVLSKNNQVDLLILFKELQRGKNLVLSEPLWIESNFFQIQGMNSYPQLVYQYSRPKPEPKLDDDFIFNPIETTQSNCLCFTIQTGREETPEVMDQLFHHLQKKAIASLIPSWYFLVYGKEHCIEIRLRILHLTPKKSKKLLSKLSCSFIQENWKWKIVDYHPEFRKYGTTGLESSHGLFHLESDFLSSASKGTRNMDLSTTIKENLILELWKSIFQFNQHITQIFKELKHAVKSMDPNLIKDFRKNFHYLTKRSKRFPNSIYLNLIQSHEFYNATESQTIYFLFNHLHMMVNRFFLTNSPRFEQKIHYRLYRELGKQIYQRSSPKVTSLPTQRVPYS